MTVVRPELVAVWQTIDWSVPPVTFPGSEIFGPDGEMIEGDAPDDTSAETDDTEGSGLDLGAPVDTSTATTVETTEP